MTTCTQRSVGDRLAALLSECDRVLALMAGTKALLDDQFSGESVAAYALCSIAAETAQAIREEIDLLDLDLHRTATGVRS